MRLTETAKIELENMVDHYTMVDLIDMLAEIAAEKAEHLRCNWQDYITARAWDGAANSITRCAADINERIG